MPNLNKTQLTGRHSIVMLSTYMLMSVGIAKIMVTDAKNFMTRFRLLLMMLAKTSIMLLRMWLYISDLAFLKRLAEDYGYAFSVRGEKMFYHAQRLLNEEDAFFVSIVYRIPKSNSSTISLRSSPTTPALLLTLCVNSNGILPMLCILNRQNPHPRHYITVFSVPKIPTWNSCLESFSLQQPS